MHRNLKRGINLAIAGNLLFLLFGLIAYWFYSIYDPKSGFVSFLEKVAYVTLIGGFICLIAAEVLFCRTIRMRTVIKAAFAGYILMEALMMYCELNSYDVKSFYDPYSVKLAILHAIVSAAVCFAFVYLDPYKAQFEIVVILCIGLILGGMFGNLIGVRVYFSMLVNAAAFAALFIAVKMMLKKEIIEIDCYGDRARVAEYRSVFFEEEIPDDGSDEPEEETAEVSEPQDELKSQAKPQEKPADEAEPQEKPKPQEKSGSKGKPSGSSGKRGGKRSNGSRNKK